MVVSAKTTEEISSLNNPIVSVLDDENDGDLSVDDISLREAVLYGNDGDTITFDPSLRNGTVLLTLGGISIDKNLTIQGFVDGALTIDGNNTSRVFNINDRTKQTLDVTLENLTITGGNAGNQKGGGIRNLENLIINKSVIINNYAKNGGGIYNDSSGKNDSKIVINDSLISGNSAELTGGGIGLYSDSLSFDDPDTLILNDSIISSNKTNYGGGIYTSLAPININNTSIEQNEAQYSGGGIYNDANTTITDSTIKENQAQSGGGIDSSIFIDIKNSTINNNQADIGGGINVSGFEGNATIINSTISGNAAAIKGGGIYKDTEYDVATVTNSTIADNSSPDGGGIKTKGSNQLILTSNVVADNKDHNDVDGAGILSGGNNLIGNGDGAPAFINLVDGDLVGTANEPIDPQLGELKDSGGLTFTHALLPE
ncbi:MAG: hypothetical protein WBM44_26800, partial [Waterburya sp.]